MILLFHFDNLPVDNGGMVSIKQWYDRVDRWLIFDPARWPHRETISRVSALTILCLFVLLRIEQFDRFPQAFDDARRFYSRFTNETGGALYGMRQIYLLWGTKLTVWGIETAIYFGYIASYLSRAKAVSVARGIQEVGFPMVVAGLPVLISLMPYSLPEWLPFTSAHHLSFYLIIMGLIAAGGTINLIGLLTMRHAFTIMSEARLLVTWGIFRYVRHPLYAGHFLMFFGSMLLRLHWVSAVLYGLFLMGQVARARIEETKLAGSFDEYVRYQRRTGMFLPKWTRPGSGSK